MDVRSCTKTNVQCVRTNQPIPYEVERSKSQRRSGITFKGDSKQDNVLQSREKCQDL